MQSDKKRRNFSFDNLIEHKFDKLLSKFYCAHITQNAQWFHLKAHTVIVYRP